MTTTEVFNYATAIFAYGSGAISAVLCGIRAWQWGSASTSFGTDCSSSPLSRLW